jgi:hypothetical protein
MPFVHSFVCFVYFVVNNIDPLGRGPHRPLPRLLCEIRMTPELRIGPVAPSDGATNAPPDHDSRPPITARQCAPDPRSFPS